MIIANTDSNYGDSAFSAKNLGEILVDTGDVGSGEVMPIGQLCSIDDLGNRVKLYLCPGELLSRMKVAIHDKWPMASFVDSGNSLIVSCDQQEDPCAENKAPVSFSGSRKIAIVGVEGSGKTVMLSGLGALYSQPDERGYFLSPKNFETVSYVNRQMAALKSGTWPVATVDDVMQSLDWDLRQRVGSGRPKRVGELSFLDFAGEVYRAAFVRKTGPDDALSEEVNRLKTYLSEANSVLVLVNLSDVIKHGPFSQRTEEAVWITNAILDYVIPEDPVDNWKMPKTAIVLSQSDNYMSTIAECGGPKGTLQKYLPHVANNYGWLETFAVCTVDKTVLDASGKPVPAPDFTMKGLSPIMEWILSK